MNFNVAGRISWGFVIDTLLVPELNQDAISTARLVLEDSGLTHYLGFLGWTAADLDTIDHLPAGAHIGLRQGTTTRILEVEAEWDSTNNRYQVININDGVLLESASGAATELLLTAGTAGAAGMADGGSGGVEELIALTTAATPADWNIAATGTILPTLDLGRVLTLADDGDKQLRIEFRTDETIENFYLWETTVRQFLETSTTTTNLDEMAHVGMTRRWNGTSAITSVSLRNVFATQRTVTGSTNTGLALAVNDNVAQTPTAIQYRVTLGTFGGGSGSAVATLLSRKRATEVTSACHDDQLHGHGRQRQPLPTAPCTRSIFSAGGGGALTR